MLPDLALALPVLLTQHNYLQHELSSAIGEKELVVFLPPVLWKSLVILEEDKQESLDSLLLYLSYFSSFTYLEMIEAWVDSQIAYIDELEQDVPKKDTLAPFPNRTRTFQFIRLSILNIILFMLLHVTGLA
jgi:hypothetical protein